MASFDMSVPRMIGRCAYIVDDDAALRNMVRRILTNAGVYTEEFGSAEALLEGYSERHPGCIILDLRLPGMNGLDLLERLSSLMPPNPVIMLSGFGDIPSAVQAVKTGALDFLQKPFSKEQLLALVNRAFQRLESFDFNFMRKLRELTPREMEVLSAFADGAPNKVVAAKLDLSPRTVEMHRKNIFQKLGVSNLTQAVSLARDSGLIR